MASPFFFVAKKEIRETWPCQDYRYLNNWTIKNTYPMPWADVVVDTVQRVGAKYFTKFDITWAFNNIRIKDRDQWKGEFKTHYGLFKLTVMFFGFCNSPATLQSMMDHIFKDEIHNKWIIVYWTTFWFSLGWRSISNRSQKKYFRNSKKMISTWSPENANSAKPKLNTLEWSLKKGKYWWTQPNSLESKTGPYQPLSKTLDHSSDLATSTKDSSRTTPVSLC